MLTWNGEPIGNLAQKPAKTQNAWAWFWMDFVLGWPTLTHAETLNRCPLETVEDEG